MALKAQDRITLRAHEFIAPAVVAAVGVLGAVEFDDEFFLPTAEVSEVWAYRVLTYELMTAKPTPLEVLPQHTFCAVFDPTQCARALGYP